MFGDHNRQVIEERCNDPEDKEYEFDGDIMVSEVLCDHCSHGLSGRCSAEPPCETYKAMDKIL